MVTTETERQRERELESEREKARREERGKEEKKALIGTLLFAGIVMIGKTILDD